MIGHNMVWCHEFCSEPVVAERKGVNEMSAVAPCISARNSMKNHPYINCINKKSNEWMKVVSKKVQMGSNDVNNVAIPMLITIYPKQERWM